MRKVLCVLGLVCILAMPDMFGRRRKRRPRRRRRLIILITVRLFDQVPDMTNSYWVEYQKRTNTKLNVTFIPDGDYATKLNLILASGDIPEVLIANPSNNPNSPPFINAVRNGAFWDLTPSLGDFSKYPNLKDNVAPNSWVTGRILGRIYGVAQNVSAVQGSPIIRKDLLDALGLPIPRTIDEFAADLKKIAAANPNIIGMVSKQDFLINSNGGLGGAFGANKPAYNAEGGLIYTKLTPAFADFIAWMRSLYSQGLLGKEFTAIKPTQAVELFQSGAAACLINESFRWNYPYTQTLQKIKQNAEATSLPPLKGPAGYAVDVGTGIVDQMFIGRKKVSENKMLRILDYFEKTTTQEYYDLTTYGVGGIHYNVVDGFKVATPLRDKELGSSAPWQVLPLMYNKYMKVDSTAAPGAYNIAKRKQLDSWGMFDKGDVNPFAVATSITWVAIWPKDVQEWASMAVKAIVGQVSMADYRGVRRSTERQRRLQEGVSEFAKSYKDVYGK